MWLSQKETWKRGNGRRENGASFLAMMLTKFIFFVELPTFFKN